MILHSYSGSSEWAKSRELGPTRRGFYLSERLAPSPLRYYRVHLAPTSRPPDVTRDEWPQAFPVFRALPLPCIMKNANRRTKTGRLETRLVKTSFSKLYKPSTGFAVLKTGFLILCRALIGFLRLLKRQVHSHSKGFEVVKAALPNF